jgi:putative transposase
VAGAGAVRVARLFDTLLEAQVLIEAGRHEYKRFRPHSSLGYRFPAPEVEVGEPS